MRGLIAQHDGVTPGVEDSDLSSVFCHLLSVLKKKEGNLIL